MVGQMGGAHGGPSLLFGSSPPARCVQAGEHGRSDEVRLGVLASGAGTLLEAAIEAGLRITVVVVDRPCRAFDVAQRAGVPAELVRRDSFGTRWTASSTPTLTALLHRYRVDVVAMAGFRTVPTRR